MKLLFDQNLAPRLVARLADLFPGSEHARDVGLAAADDRGVWEYAKAGAFAIVSKDADLRQLSFLCGSPPKVVWLRVGNKSTAKIETIVRAHAPDFEAFDADPVASMLVVTAQSPAGRGCVAQLWHRPVAVRKPKPPKGERRLPSASARREACF